MNQFQPIDVNGWHQSDTIRFDIAPTDTTLDYDVYIQARITRSYEYKDLWMVAEHDLPASYSTAQFDTIHLVFTDSDGNFEGQGRDFLEYKQPIRFIHLPKGESGTIRIHHIMNQQTVKGVHDIGVALLPL